MGDRPTVPTIWGVWIAIHRDLNGKPGPVVGKKDIPEGASRSVVIPLDSPVTTGAFWAMLHTDAGKIGTYEFPGADKPVKSESGVVQQKIILTVK